jgi:hypothetical protein
MIVSAPDFELGLLHPNAGASATPIAAATITSKTRLIAGYLFCRPITTCSCSTVS